MKFYVTPKLIGFTAFLGQGIHLLGECVTFLFKGRIRWAESLKQAAKIGADSLPMVLLLSSIGGAVLALQTASRFSQTGADAYVGGLVSLAIVREIAPIFTAMTVGARSGTAIASEIAQMKSSDQLAALQVLGTHSSRYLVLPRLLASVLTMPLLTVAAEATGILSGMLVAKQVSGLNYPIYMESIWLMLKPYDIHVSLFKATIFGVILAISCCTIGFSAGRNSKEVGLSALRAAVWTAILVIVADFILSWIYFTGQETF